MVKTFAGTVISTKMEKTVIVEVKRVYRHRLYKKIVKKHKKYKAHNDEFDIKKGDEVRIQETRPISKEKRFRVIEKIG